MKKDADGSIIKELFSALVTDFIGIPGRNTLRLIAKALVSVGKSFAPLYEAFAKGSGCGCFLVCYALVGIAALAMNFAGSPYIAVAVVAVIFFAGYKYDPEPSNKTYHPRCPECIYFEDCKGGANFDLFKSKIFTLAKNPSFTEFLTKVPCTNQRIAEEPPPLPPPPPPSPPSSSIYSHPRCPECIYFNICKGGAYSYLLPYDLNFNITAETQQEAIAEVLKLVPCANIKSIKSDV